jgi:hypothetical protein
MAAAVFEANATHQAFRTDCLAVLRRHAGKLSAQEMLALSAHLVGSIIAMQDHHNMTPDMAMDIVHSNMAMGNAEAVEEMLNGPAAGTA